MWEHRTISDAHLQEHRRVQPMESYVDLTQKITRTMEVAEGHVFDHEDFLRYVPQEGPWMPQMDSDMTRADPRTRYIGKGKATLVNTNIILGSSWIEAERFRYERDLKSTADWMKQKTIMNANMWTPRCSSSRPRTVGPSGTPSFGGWVTAVLCPVPTPLSACFTLRLCTAT